MRIAVLDDSALFREGLSLLLTSLGEEVVLVTSDPDGLVRQVGPLRVELAILDIRMPPTFTDEGLRVASRLRAEHPGIAILVLSTYAETSYAVQVLGIGERAVGYLLKDRVSDGATLVDALGRIAAGETVVDPDIVTRLLNRQRTTTDLDRLTPREKDVLRLMAEGRSNNGIAAQLFVTPKAVEKHIANIFGKLNLYADAAEHHRRVLAVLTYLRSQRDEM